MIQKIANILTFGMWKRPQQWWRAHPKFTIAFVIVEGIVVFTYIKRKTQALVVGDEFGYQYDMAAIEAEIAADPVGWYIKNGLNPYSHEEKNAFRTRYQQFEDYSDTQIEKLFEAKKSEVF